MTISCSSAVFPFDLVETYICVLLELVFDKSKQVLLIHTGGVVDMGINLSNIVEVTDELALILGKPMKAYR